MGMSRRSHCKWTHYKHLREGLKMRDDVRGFWTYEDKLVTNIFGEKCDPRTGKVEWIDQGDNDGTTIVRNPTG